MHPASLFALDPSSWLPRQLWLPSLVGVGAALLGVVAFHFLIRPRAAAAVAPPPPAEEAAFDPFVQGSASEQRKTHRRTGNSVEVLIRPSGSKGAPLHGWVVDRSTGGLCLSAEREFQEGVTLELRPVTAPEITPWTEVTVRTVRRGADHWQVGCQFVRTPPWAMLLMFG